MITKGATRKQATAGRESKVAERRAQQVFMSTALFRSFSEWIKNTTILFLKGGIEFTKKHPMFQIYILGFCCLLVFKIKQWLY